MDYNINELNTKQNAFLIVFYLNIAIFKPGGQLMAHKYTISQNIKNLPCDYR